MAGVLSVRCRSASPLDTQHVAHDRGDTALIRVYDAAGRLYVCSPGPEVEFPVSGALGTHVVTLHDESGAETERATFSVDCRTEIDDEGGRFKKLLYLLRSTLELFHAKEKLRVFDGERVYRMQTITSRGSVHGVKGARYFMRHLRDSPDLFARHQREDGMIWDFGTPVDPNTKCHFEWRWGPQFSKRIYHDTVIFARQPVMNDVEHVFIKGIYLAWQATGDDEWMAGKLDSALRAVKWTRTSPYVWSDKFQCMRRPYCLDLWDFQSEFDSALVGGDIMDAKPGVTKYGIFYGDNICMMDACRKLAAMLEHCGRTEEAEEMRAFADHLLARMNELAWNGEFYRHHVTEHPEFVRDFGVDEASQVSLSNTYAANAEIGHEKSVAIIETYRRIRREMPEGCPAEWLTMYPPFPRGFHVLPWVYCNGACTGMVAGELAHACFEHGYEEYGADILDRFLDLFWVPGAMTISGLWGKRPEEPERSFGPLDLSRAANADLVCEHGSDRPGWGGEPGVDMRELPTGEGYFRKVRFRVIAPDSNGGRAIVRLARGRAGWAESVQIPIGRAAASVYFLHAMGTSGQVAGQLSVDYEDGSRHEQSILRDRHVMGFWNPGEPPGYARGRTIPSTVLGWAGPTNNAPRVGLTAWGWQNPHPEKVIAGLTLHASVDGEAWFVVAMSLSDAAPWFEPSENAGGPPPFWNAGSLTYALMEGLAGVVDTDRNMRSVTVSPRWEAAGVRRVTACAKYEEGGGYVRYRYERSEHALHLLVAGSGERRRLEVLLPEDARVAALRINRQPTPHEVRRMEDSRYICADLEGPGAHEMRVDLK